MWKTKSNLLVGIVTFVIGVVSVAVVTSESEDVRPENSKVVILMKECTPVAPRMELPETRLGHLAELNKKILETELALADLRRENKLLSEKAELEMRIRILQLEIKLDELKLELNVELEKAVNAPSEKLLYRELCYEN